MIARVKRLLRLLWKTPFMSRTLDAALLALDERNWPAVEKLTFELHEAGFYMDDTHFLRGLALMHLERWEEALSEFEEIGGQLVIKGNDARRWINQAIALIRLGRPDEAGVLLRSKMAEDWPVERRRKAQLVLDEIDCL